MFYDSILNEPRVEQQAILQCLLDHATSSPSTFETRFWQPSRNTIWTNFFEHFHLEPGAFEVKDRASAFDFVEKLLWHLFQNNTYQIAAWTFQIEQVLPFA